MPLKNTIFYAVAALVTLFFSACGNNSKVVLSENDINQPYYTQVNLWYQKKNTYDSDSMNQIQQSQPSFASDYTIASTNYDKGTLLPINSLVKVIKLDSNKIFFESNGNLIALVRTKHSKHVSLNDIFKRTFSHNTVKLNDFSANVLKNIQQGQISLNMTKEEVILSRGYPPEHRTRTLHENSWYYWHSTANSQRLQFNNNILTDIKE